MLKGVIKPFECKVFGTACTPERPIGTCMVSSEGACAAYYNYGRFAREREVVVGVLAVSEREQRVLGIIETARAKRAKFRDERITMAHGAGGKATRSLVEGLLAPAFGIETLDDAALVGDARASPPTRSWSSRCASRAARSASSRSTAPSTTSRWRARGRSRSRVSLILEEGLDAATSCAPRSTRSRARREAAGVRIVGGDTKVVERGHADGMYITTTGLGRRDPRAAFEPARPGDRILLSGPIAAHGTAIMLARGEFDLDADEIVSDTRSLWPAVDAHPRAGRPRGCATPPAAASPPCSTSSRATRASRC